MLGTRLEEHSIPEGVPETQGGETSPTPSF